MVAAKEAGRRRGNRRETHSGESKKQSRPRPRRICIFIGASTRAGSGRPFRQRHYMGRRIAGSARDMLAVAEANDRDGATSASAEARSFLSEVLSVGPISAKEVFRQAAEAGIARRTLTRAKADAGVETKRSGGCPCGKFRPLGVRVRNVRALSRKSIFAKAEWRLSDPRTDGQKRWIDQPRPDGTIGHFASPRR
jgi:hypothetical protein